MSVPATAPVDELRPTGPRGWWRRLPARWRRAIVATLLLRVALGVAAVLAGGLIPPLDPVSVPAVPGTGFAGWVAHSPADQGWGLLGAGLERADALWYLAIAEHGYPVLAGQVPQAAAFFPGFPLLVAIVGALVGSVTAAGTLVALAATVVALAGLHRLVEDEGGGRERARRTVLVAAVYPSAFFLVAPFTESLFLAASVWTLVFARRGDWWPALAAGVLAGATRNVGVLLAVPVLVEAWRQRAPAGLLASLGAPAGLGGVLLFAWIRFGTPLAPVSAQSGWQRTFTWPWQTLADAARFALDTPGQYASGYHTLDLVLFLPVAAAVVWLFRRAPAAFAWYALAHVLVWLVYPFAARPLMSTPRFALAVAPLFLAYGAWTRRRLTERTWTAVSAGLLGIQVLLFVGGYYIF